MENGGFNYGENLGSTGREDRRVGQRVPGVAP